MDHYVDIQVLPDPEFSETILMSALFSKFHRALVAVGYGSVGVSFPRAAKTPGNLLRLHGPYDDLVRLMDMGWLKSLSDYTIITGIRTVPDVDYHVRVQRIQPKQTAAKLRRAVMRGSMTEEQAQKLLSQQMLLKQPFFQLTSQSTGQKFPLFICQENAPKAHNNEKFNSYGLSSVSVVPFF